VRAIVNSRHTINFTQGVSLALATGALAVDTPMLPDAAAPTRPLVSGPPALQTAIGEPEVIYLPIVMREP
jgi:hypothetical protein